MEKVVGRVALVVGLALRGGGGELDEFVAGGFEVHLGEWGIEINLLDGGEEGGVGGCFFLGGSEESGVMPLAEEAAGVFEEGRCGWRAESAGVGDGALEGVAGDGEIGAGGCLVERGVEEGEEANGEALEGISDICLGVL